jgi:hypothetical protein
MTAVGSKQKAAGGGQMLFILTPDSRTLNPVSFQQHSRFQRVTTFVFYNIPALRPPAKSRSFVFNDIPVLFVRFST